MQKKGFIRIVEAMFAILIIMGAALVLISNNIHTSDISEQVYEKQRYILDVIANDEQMRQQIINNETDLVDRYIEKNIPSTWGFSTCVTEIDKICNNSPPEADEVYVTESIISATTTTYTSSKKLRFFIWIE